MIRSGLLSLIFCHWPHYRQVKVSLSVVNFGTTTSIGHYSPYISNGERTYLTPSYRIGDRFSFSDQVGWLMNHVRVRLLSFDY